MSRNATELSVSSGDAATLRMIETSSTAGGYHQCVELQKPANGRVASQLQREAMSYNADFRNVRTET